METETDTYTRIGDIPHHQLQHFSQKVMFAAKEGHEWKEYATDEVIEELYKISSGLLEIGLKAGDKVGLISNNRPQWNLVDLGAQQVGIITVPIYPKISSEEIKHIVNDSGLKVLVVEDAELYKKVQEVKDEHSSVEHIYSFEKTDNVDHWEGIKKEADKNKIDELREKVEQDEVATIVYTSGTTGKPKGVMLTHKNIVSNVQACLELMPVDDSHRALSFLPLNHVFERMLNYLYMAGGISIYYAESIDQVGENIKEVQPHIFTTVPRLLEKIYEKIVSKGKELSLVKKGIFFWALNLAQRYDLEGRNWFYNKQLQLADKLVYSKWREAVGGEVISIISGGAALNEHINRVFHAAQIPIMEGYGLTETSPVIAVNRFEVEKRKIGTVGPPLDNVEVKINEEDGEILCKGPNVMKGYYNLEKKTKEVLDDDGWFHTEDIGELKDGFLSITDRKKHMFKTSGGKYVAPQNVEGVMKESHLIGQIMAVGESKKMVTALIVPDFENLKGWCKKKSIGASGNKEMIENDQVIKKYKEVISKKNQKLNHTEQIKRFILMEDEWSEGSGELTPTLKVKRKIVEEKYEDEMNNLYNGDEAIDVN